jgi:hypothetical protein
MNTIKNLSQLKAAISGRQKFQIIKHYVHEGFAGQIRTPNVIQTNGFYSIIEDEPTSKITTANYGKGYWYGYEKATCYEFNDDSILFKFSNGEPCMEIAFI